MSIRQHYEGKLTEVRQLLEQMTGCVDTACRLSVEAMRLLNPAIRDQVRVLERKVDGFDSEVEHRCHLVMALEAPLAADLRFLISAMRISADLEQISDLAKRIVKRFPVIPASPGLTIPPALNELGVLVGSLVHPVMEAFTTGDIDRVRAVFDAQARQRELAKRAQAAIQEAMRVDPDQIHEYVQILRSIDYFKQIYEQCAHIGEEVVFYHKGALIRHRHEALDDAPEGGAPARPPSA